MKRKELMMMAVLVVLLTSCTRKVRLTGELKTKLDEQRVNYHNVQFYNKGTFSLMRKNFSEAMVASNGKLRMKKKNELERIKFKTGTKATCDTIIGTTLYMRFEKGDGKLLSFRINQWDLFELVPDQSDTSGNYVMYSGMNYRIINFGNITLQAKRKKVNEAHKQTRKIKGVMVTS
jgi:hypothetical protein